MKNGMSHLEAVKRFLNKRYNNEYIKENTFLIVTCSSLVSSIVVAQNISEKIFILNG